MGTWKKEAKNQGKKKKRERGESGTGKVQAKEINIWSSRSGSTLHTKMPDRRAHVQESTSKSARNRLARVYHLLSGPSLAPVLVVDPLSLAFSLLPPLSFSLLLPSREEEEDGDGESPRLPAVGRCSVGRLNNKCR